MGCAFGSTGYHQLTKLKIRISSEKPWFYWLHPCQAQMMNSLNFGTSPTRSSMQGHPGGVRVRLDTPPQGRDNSTGTAMKEAEFLLLKCPAQRGAPCSAWNPCSLPGQGHSLTFQHNSWNFSPNRHKFFLQFNFWQELNENNAYKQSC